MKTLQNKSNKYLSKETQTIEADDFSQIICPFSGLTHNINELCYVQTGRFVRKCIYLMDREFEESPDDRFVMAEHRKTKAVYCRFKVGKELEVIGWPYPRDALITIAYFGKHP